MATVASIAIRKEAAFDQIASAAATIGAELGLEAPTFELYGRDPDEHHAQHLEQVAEYLQKIADLVSARAVQAVGSENNPLIDPDAVRLGVDNASGLDQELPPADQQPPTDEELSKGDSVQADEPPLKDEDTQPLMASKGKKKG